MARKKSYDATVEDVETETASEASATHTTMQAPEGCSSIEVSGDAMKVSKYGTVSVPNEHVETLTKHGFTVAE